MRHAMVDIETLGTRPGSVILSIGAVRFDESGLGEQFYRAIDVFDSLMHGLVVDPDTVGWWREQSAVARGALKPALPLREVLAGFTAFVTKPPVPCVWAKGPDFDLVMLGAAYRALGMKQPWSYRNARDVRTMLALAPLGGQLVPGVKHNALDDAVYQAEQVRTAAFNLGCVLSEMA